MKKAIVLISFILLIVVVVLEINMRNHSDINENLNDGSKIYLQEIILEQVMFDYNYLTGNTEEITREYFEALKVEKGYPIQLLERLEIQKGSSLEIVMKIQNEYSDLIQNLSNEEKELLDKYLLDQTLKFYYENTTANV